MQHEDEEVREKADAYCPEAYFGDATFSRSNPYKKYFKNCHKSRYDNRVNARLDFRKGHLIKHENNDDLLGAREG